MVDLFFVCRRRFALDMLTRRPRRCQVVDAQGRRGAIGRDICGRVECLDAEDVGLMLMLRAKIHSGTVPTVERMPAVAFFEIPHALVLTTLEGFIDVVDIGRRRDIDCK